MFVETHPSADFDTQRVSPHVASIGQLVPGNRLLANLPPGERQRLVPYLETVSLRFRQVLVEFDTRIEYVYFLDTAVTSTVVRTPNGETIEVGIMGDEDSARKKRQPKENLVSKIGCGLKFPV